MRSSGLPAGRLMAKPATNGWPSAIATISRRMPASRVGLSLRITGTRGSHAARRREQLVDALQLVEEVAVGGRVGAAQVQRDVVRAVLERAEGRGVVLVDLRAGGRARGVVGLDQVQADRDAARALQPLADDRARRRWARRRRRRCPRPAGSGTAAASGCRRRRRRRPSRSRGGRSRARRASGSRARSCRSRRRGRSGWPAGCPRASSPGAGRGTVRARPAARRTRSERPPSSDARSVRLCARSASRRNSSGRTADS